MPATTKTASKPRLNNLDDLLMLRGNTARESSFQHPTDTEYGVVDFSLMDDYPNHPFCLYEGQRKSDMTESIRQKGVLQPLILRVIDDERYMILAGHNRKYCGLEAGLTSAPAIIKRGLTDEEAWMYVIETNLLQRSFSDMLPSEKAAVLAAYHSKLFSQGKRNDILAEIEELEKHTYTGKKSTFAKFSKSSRTRETLAEEYGLTPSQVALYLRADKLIEPLKKRLNNKEMPLFAAVSMSFLTATEQWQVEKCLGLNSFKADVKKSTMLRRYSAENKLNEDQIYLILSGEAVRSAKNNTVPTIRVSKNIYAKYFTLGQSEREIQSVVEKALGHYFDYLQSQKRQ